jgi:ribonuclease VapC
VIVDSSAVLAILLQEPEKDAFAAAIQTAEICRLSAATFFEVSIVIESQTGDAGVNRLQEFVRRAEIVIEPFTADQAYRAGRAWSEYGKGRHKAALNFGDCFSYALAKSLDEPLLFKGDDFSMTDIEPAIR